MNSQEEKTYFSLREEIRYNQNQENVISTFTYTTCVAILAFAFGQENELAALLAQLTLIPFSYKVGRFRDSIAYLASYLCVVIEPQINGTWEQDNCIYRKKYPYLKGLLVKISRCDFLMLSIICILSGIWLIVKKSLLFSETIYCIILLVAHIISVAVIIVFTIKYSDVGKMKNDKIDKWEKLKKDNQLVNRL